MDKIVRWLFIIFILTLSCSAQILSGVGIPSTVVSAPTVVEIKECDGAATPLNCSLASAMAGGNTAVVIVNSNNGTCTSVTSTPSNTFQPWLAYNVGSIRHSVFIARNVANNTNSFVAPCPGMASFDSMVIYNLAPQAGMIVAGDVFGTNSGTGGTHTVSTLASVGISAEEVIGTVFENSDFFAWTAGTGYTTRASFNVSAGKHLGISEDNNTKTGLSGVQTATVTSANTFAWVMSIIGMANVPSHDVADTFINFEGLSNGSQPTVNQLNASTWGVPLSWDITNSGTPVTGATGSQLGTLLHSAQIGATLYTGSGTLGLAYTATAPPTKYVSGSFPVAIGHVSWISQFKTTLPQNDTVGNAYSFHRVIDNTSADYVGPQLQATGAALQMKLECKSGPSAGSIATASNTLYYIGVDVVNNSGTHSMKMYDSTGAQVGSTLTCAAAAGATAYTVIQLGVTGAEAEGTGVLSWDNIRISLQGATLTP